jgi:hypothetical protein
MSGNQEELCEANANATCLPWRQAATHTFTNGRKVVF